LIGPRPQRIDTLATAQHDAQIAVGEADVGRWGIQSELPDQGFYDATPVRLSA